MSNKDLSEDDYDNDINENTSRKTEKQYININNNLLKSDYINGKNKNNNFYCYLKKILLVVFCVIIIFYFRSIVSHIGQWLKKPNKKNEIYSSKIYFSHFYEKDGNEHESKAHIINETGLYEICIFGASAIEGGKGGKVCCKHPFEIGDIIDFYFEGRAAGGKGGKKCGWRDKGDAYDGAGLGQALLRGHEKEFKIIAGGGGGSSENNFCKGGNAEENGVGKYGGKGAKNKSFGAKGNDDAKDGEYFHGGEGGKFSTGYCGGGGGNGYFGGGGGGHSIIWSDAGGGGGGSNFFVSKYECNYYHNNKFYSGGTLEKL